MLTRSRFALTLICTALLCSTSAWAQSRRDAVEEPAARDAKTWLGRIHQAASRQNYQGTFVVSSSGGVASARLAHYCEGSNTYERIESLDGKARNVFRYNELVHTVWPASKVAVVEQRDLLNSFPALLQAGAEGLGDWYEVTKQGLDRVAGHEADVVVVKPRDGLRYGYRLWSDKASGLLLRTDVLGDGGEVLETSAFSDVVIGGRAQPDSVLQPMRKLDGFRILRPVLRPTRLEAEGWSMRQLAPGFRQVSCVNREMDRPGDAAAAGSAQQVLQVVYADGMTYVSVFIEPFEPRRHPEPMAAGVGATRTLSMRQGEWWVTVIGDVPANTLRLFANGLERRK